MNVNDDNNINKKRDNYKNPIDFIKNINYQINKEISETFEQKKTFLYQIILNCYDFITNVENKLDKDKFLLELLFEEKLLIEKKLFIEEETTCKF